jgi:eukaryotic-like serine/threonine-protein kinase
LSDSANQQTPYGFSLDGQSLVYGDLDRKTDYDLFVRSMTDGSTKPLIKTPFAESNAEISADGRWLAYQSNATEQDQIYVRPFPAVDTGQWQVSTAGGTRPLWSRSGRELFYLDLDGRLMTVPVTSAPTFSTGSPTVLLENLFFPGVPGRYYDVSPDGSRFLVITRSPGDQSDPPQLNVVLNWSQELQRLAPRK